MTTERVDAPSGVHAAFQFIMRCQRAPAGQMLVQLGYEMETGRQAIVIELMDRGTVSRLALAVDDVPPFLLALSELMHRHLIDRQPFQDLGGAIKRTWERAKHEPSHRTLH